MSAGRKDGDHPWLGVVVVVVVVVLRSNMVDMIRIGHGRVKGCPRLQRTGPWVDGESSGDGPIVCSHWLLMDAFAQYSLKRDVLPALCARNVPFLRRYV